MAERIVTGIILLIVGPLVGALVGALYLGAFAWATRFQMSQRYRRAIERDSYNDILRRSNLKLRF